MVCLLIPGIVLKTIFSLEFCMLNILLYNFFKKKTLKFCHLNTQEDMGSDLSRIMCTPFISIF